MRPTDLLTITPQGLYCPPGDFHIDPVRPVPRALITHGHADHARSGHGKVMATKETLAIMSVRYGEAFAETTAVADLGKTLTIGGVDVSFHPAGHVLGSAQIALEAGGTRIVASGDYKRAGDPTCQPFEVVPCDVFITEATFGLPIFQFGETMLEIEKLLKSVALFPDRAHLVGAYALGKAQRVIALLRQAGYDRPIYIHGAMERLTALYERLGVFLGPIVKVAAADRAKLAGEIVLCPPSSLKDLWSRRFPRPRHRICERLDANQGTRAAETDRIAACDLGPRRLDRPSEDNRADRRRGNLGHAWSGGCARPLVPQRGLEGKAPSHDRLWR